VIYSSAIRPMTKILEGGKSPSVGKLYSTLVRLKRGNGVRCYFVSNILFLIRVCLKDRIVLYTRSKIRILNFFRNL